MFLTYQELLSPAQMKTPVEQGSVEREETVASDSLKEFALKNFRYYQSWECFYAIKQRWEK